MVSTKFKPHSPFSWKHAIEKAEIKIQYRTKRCNEMKTVPPKPKKVRRQSNV